MPYSCKSHERREKERRGRDYQSESRERYTREESKQLQRMRTSRQWARVRRMVLAGQPMCADPFGYHADDAHPVPAVEVHHLVPAAQRIDLFYEQANLQPLCRHCHAKLSAKERAR